MADRQRSVPTRMGAGTHWPEIETNDMNTTTELTPKAVDALRQWVYELMAAPDAAPGELKAAALLFRECGGASRAVRQKDAGREKYQADTAATGLERRAELPTLEEEENPLDDQEKLDEIRRRVFGSAPE
jgi:hypothetical protein